MRARAAGLLAACLCALALVPGPKTAIAEGLSGSEWTAIIAGGVAATYEFGYRLPFYAAKLRGTVREAEGTVRVPYDSTAQGSYVVALAHPPEPDSVTVALPGASPIPCATPNAQLDETSQLTASQCVYTVAPDGSSMTLHYGIGGAASLDQIRAQIIQTVAFMPKSAPKGQMPKDWRRPYEALRACWNRLIYVDPKASSAAAPAAAKPDASASAKPELLASGTPSPAPLIAPGNCAAGVVPDGQPLDIIFAGQYVDLVDAAAAFTSAPSLRQQIVDQRVGTYRSANVGRGEVLARLGGAFAATSPAAVPVVHYKSRSGPFGAHAEVAASGIPGEINAGYTSCVVKFSPFGCFSALDTAETNLESSLATNAGCRFARRYWLPPVGTIALVYSAQMIASAAPGYWPFPTADVPAPAVPTSPSLADIEAETRFGAVPGC